MDIQPEWYGKRIKITDWQGNSLVGIACHETFEQDTKPDYTVIRLKYVGGYQDYTAEMIKNVEVVELETFEGNKRDIGIVRT